MSFMEKILISENETLAFFNRPEKRGGVAFYLSREPSFFQALEVEGETSEVYSIVDGRTGEIAGACVCSVKECYINGIPEKVAYYNSIKIAPGYRGGWVLARMVKTMRAHAPENCRICFFSLMQDNKVSRALFFSGRSMLPFVKPVSEYKTLIFKPSKHKIKIPSGVRIVRATEIPVEELTDFLNREGARKTLFPVYKKQHFLDPHKGLLRGLDREQLWVAVNQQGIVGTLGLWNQTPFRRWVLYRTFSFSFLQPFVNLWARIKGMPLMPGRKQDILCKYLALICITNNDKEVFTALFHHVMHQEALSGTNSVLVMGYPAHNPMYAGLKIKALTLHSQIAIFSWQDALIHQSLSFDNLYIETAAL
jgi:hypothetical protein